MTGTCGTSGPLPTMRSCSRQKEYLNEPMICWKLFHFGPCRPVLPGKPISGMEPRIRRSILVRTETALLDVDLMNGGINRLSENNVASGVNTELASLITLCPLVSVPAIDGNFDSSSVVAPTSTTRSAIAEV